MTAGALQGWCCTRELKQRRQSVNNTQWYVWGVRNKLYIKSNKESEKSDKWRDRTTVGEKVEFRVMHVSLTWWEKPKWRSWWKVNRHFFCLTLECPRGSSPSRRSISSPLSFYDCWWVTGGCLLYSSTCPHSHTSHLPSRHQYSHDPLQQPHSSMPASTEENFYIINTLKKVMSVSQTF